VSSYMSSTQKKGSGPILFYLKSFFVAMPDTYQLVYEQMLHRSDFVIKNDPQLTWLVLHYPLRDLLMSEINKTKNYWNSYILILVRGYFYYLKRNLKILDQTTIENAFMSVCDGTSSYLVDGICIDVDPSIIEDEETYNRYMDETIPASEKPTVLSAFDNIFVQLFKQTETFHHQHIFLQDCGVGLNKNESNSMFLSLSQLLYGSRIYYLNLRHFLVFYYNAVSMLPGDHPFYNNPDIEMHLYQILNRIYGNKIPKKFFHEEESDRINVEKK
jgi:hypothetical protein